MDSNRARSSRWRSASSPRRDDDEDVDPHTVVSAPPPAAAAAAASRPSTAPTSSPAPAGNNNNNNLQPPPPRYSFARRLGSLSRQSLNPATPDAVEDSETEYFPALGTTSSAVSRASSIRGRAPSTVGSDAGRPTYERTRQPSIRIRRSSSGSQAPPIDYASESSDTDGGTRFGIRPRSISQPSPAAQSNDGNVARHSRRVPQLALPRLTEEGSRPTMAELGVPMSPARSLPDHRLDDDEQRRRLSAGSEPGRRLTRKRKLSKLLWPGSLNRGSPAPPSDTEAGGNAAQGHAQGRPQPQSDEYGEGLVDWLDIIDPEVQTLSTLTNVQNSLFVPDLGPWINRRPTYVLSQRETGPLSRLARPAEREEERLPEIPDEASAVQTGVEPTAEAEAEGPTTLRRSDTITSRLTDSHYAALPHGFSLEGWTEEEKMELDDRVRHMLHSRRSRFKRTMKGFGQYVRRPLGFFVTLYATLITLFGLAWVLFLIGWIYVGDKQVYTIHIIDSVLVALFAIMGDGLAPFRAVDTYHMAFVVHYSRKIAKAKKQKQKLKDKEAAVIEGVGGDSVELAHCASGDPLRDNAAQVGAGLGSNPQSAGVSFERLASSSSNLPTGTPAPMPVPVPAPAPELEQAMVDHNADVEAAKLDIEYDQDSPLTFKQWKRMRHHQKKLAKSHSFYKPDETFTHHAFPLSYLIAIVILLDCHSCLQISLGATTWGIDYHHRPFAITTVILCVSITCNITAGLVITIGDRKTRKKDVWKLLTRQELTGDAIKHLETKRAKEQSRSHGSSQNSIQDEVQTDAVIIKEDN